VSTIILKRFDTKNLLEVNEAPIPSASTTEIFFCAESSNFAAFIIVVFVLATAFIVFVAIDTTYSTILSAKLFALRKNKDRTWTDVLSSNFDLLHSHFLLVRSVICAENLEVKLMNFAWIEHQEACPGKVRCCFWVDSTESFNALKRTVFVGPNDESKLLHLYLL